MSDIYLSYSWTYSTSLNATSLTIPCLKHFRSPTAHSLMYTSSQKRIHLRQIGLCGEKAEFGWSLVNGEEMRSAGRDFETSNNLSMESSVEMWFRDMACWANN